MPYPTKSQGKEVIIMANKTGYISGVIVGLFIGAIIFLTIAQITARW